MFNLEMFNFMFIFSCIFFVVVFIVIVVAFVNTFRSQGKVKKIFDESLEDIREQNKKNLELESNDVEYRVLKCPSCGVPLQKDLNTCPSCGVALVQVKRRKNK